MANSYVLDLELSSSQHASAADSASVSQTGDMTIEFWLKLEQLPSAAGTSMIVVGKNETGDYSYGIQLNSGDDKLTFGASDDGTTYDFTCTSENAITDAAWHHYAVAFDISGSTGQWYVDGSADTSVDSGTSDGTTNDNTAKLTIGAQFADGTPERFVDGKVDEVRIWSDIRSGAEISANYQSELAGNEAGLVAYWKLNNSYLDETTNNNDLTSSGSPVFSADVPFAGVTSNFFALL